MRRYVYKVFLVLFLLLTSSFVFVSDAGNITKCAGIIPNGAVQDKINSIALIDSRNESIKAIEELELLAPENHEDLVLQLIYYQQHNQGNEKKLWGSLLILEQLWVQIDTNDMIAAVVPHLDVSDPSLKAALNEVLDELLYVKEQREYNFHALEATLRAQKDSTPIGLMEYMFQASPSQAFMVYANVFVEDSQNKSTLLSAADPILQLLESRKSAFRKSQPIDKEIISGLNQLSMENIWWIRLFVAQAVARCQGFQTPEIINRLSRDDNPFVREIVSSIKARMPPIEDVEP